MMPKSVVVAFFVEALLISCTTTILIQPKFLFRIESPQWKALLNWAGMLLLCLTFCWSVIFGIVLSFNDVVIRI